jgi:hypothetical protein
MCQATTRDDDDPRSEEEEEDDENLRIIRAKWVMDGARTLEEAALRLERYAAYIRALRDDGWELRAAIDDDYGYLRYTAPQPQPPPQPQPNA